MNLRFLLVFAALMIVGSSAQAQKLYKWVDPDGRVSYHDQPPTDGGYRVEEKALRLSGEKPSEANGDAAGKYPVVLYSAPKCGACDAARVYLQKRRVPFTEKNVEGDRKLQEELIKQAGGLSVPTVTVGAKVMRGYLESLLEGELDAAGYPKDADAETAKKE